MTGNVKASARVTAINTSPVPSVDVSLLGGQAAGLRYPVWYTPQLNDLVVVDWIGSQPYVATVFA